MSDRKSHWESIYQTKRADEVSWFQREPALSLDTIRRVVPDQLAHIVDVGGGASTLVDGLLQAGYTDLTVLDLSRTALDHARARVGAAAARVQWLEGDILTTPLPEARFDLWHDRAVFHFLTEAVDRTAYVGQVRRALRPGGYLLVATFAEDGPTRCSGLPVARYSAQALHAEFDGGFRLIESVRELHTTPSGATQSFVYCLCRFDDRDSTRAVRSSSEAGKDHQQTPI